jgi:hypothetical protein
MIKTNITDGTEHQYKAEVTADNALKVAPVMYEIMSPAAKFFQHPLYGIDMNRNFSDTPAELIHNGTDSSAWTATQIIGTSMVFDDTNNPDTGSKNISITNSTNGDIALFDRGSDITITNQVALQGRIYITSINDVINSEVMFTAYDIGLLSTVGNEVSVFDYVDISLLGVYQTFNIPIVDLVIQGLTFDAFQMRLVKNGQTFDLDNIRFTQAGVAIGTTTYELSPEKGTDLYLDGFIINMADAYTGKVADGTMPSLRYDGFLGLAALSSPMVYRVHNNEEITFIATFSQLIDFMQFGSPQFRGTGSDGTNSWFTLYIGLNAPIILHAALNQKVTMTLSSNLAGLDFFRFSSDCRSINV